MFSKFCPKKSPKRTKFAWKVPIVPYSVLIATGLDKGSVFT